MEPSKEFIAQLEKSFAACEPISFEGVVIGIRHPDRNHSVDLEVASPIDWASKSNRYINALSVAKDLTKDLNARDSVSKAIYAGAVYIITSNLASTKERTYKVVPQPEIQADKAEEIVNTVLSDKSVIEKAMTLAYATKVNWFLTDHHIGQERVGTCVSNVLKNVFNINYEISKQLKEAIWRYGHLMDTQLALKALGYMDHETSDPPASYPAKVHPDIAVFADRFPSGTACLGAANEAFKIMRENDLWKHYPDKVMAERLTKLIESVKANRAVYHVDAEYIGLDQKRADLSQDEKTEIGAIVHAVAPNSSVSRSKSIPKLQEVEFRNTYFILRFAMSKAQSKR